MLDGESQDAIAKKVGVSQGNVANWERKDMFPRDNDIAMKLANALHAPVGYLAYGDSPISSAVWEPQPPKNPRHLATYKAEIQSLFPVFCAENEITLSVYYRAENGIIFFLGATDQILKYLLLVKSDVVDCFLEAMNGLTKHEITILEGYPPLRIGNFDLDEFLKYASFFEKKGFTIDTHSIGTALAKVRKLQQGVIEVPNSIECAFIIFHHALEMFDVPEKWSENLTIRFSDIFKRLHESIVDKPLVGKFTEDEELELEQMISPLLEGCGLKRKMQSTR
jgi:transcriptional regulator with XRE-family HTH domain